ncbi:MAG: precorrin-4 C(11)-methyltransferase [Methanobacteriaceae archaeon]|nr:precorrin-4 C(11)-methyltransferase [Methanobacteriaceae archaeon]MDP2835607.1 precorrin-4 C(11)-methyltransferase [Methanobacteriaceae archaeon]MDP3033794.1 precorrin-4 C(11)-methyltransferase [Methanobacteriaceae archaeon]MDP3484592.1 precorrin-4 C(11)-methyltransferase [Methanobacteriaceae archaeon]
MIGKVIFIGGGPGDPELLTVKAYKVIENAEIIIYAGSLVNKDILSCAREDATIHNSASLNLNEIIDLMESGVLEGKTVARVHTGDPAIYGAIGEQIRGLDKKGIEYDIIPGVSSLFATAAALRSELTLPEISQTVIITRPEGRTPKPSKESISSLASHQATMCIFLGVHMIKNVVEDLLSHYPLDTPVGVVQKASWPEEIVVRGNLENISKKVDDAGIKKTAMIVVGPVLDPGDFKASKLYDATFKHEYRDSE